jgi:transposase
MRKIREILRLVWSCGQSRRAVARAVSVGKATVDDTVSRALAAGLSWPLQLDDEALETLLYPPVVRPASRKPVLPDWRVLHDELISHKHLTLMLLWQE